MDRHTAVTRRVWQKDLRKIRQNNRSGAESVDQPRSFQARPKPSPLPAKSALRFDCTVLNRAVINAASQLVRHPYKAIGAAWLLSLCIGSVAAISIFKIELQPITTAQSEPSVAESPSAPANIHVSPTLVEDQFASQPTDRSSEEGQLPLFSLGVVAVGCAVGCLMLSRALSTTKASPPPRLAACAYLPRPPIESAQGKTRKASVKSAAISPLQPRFSQAPQPAVSPSVVPDNEAHPLDWDEPSLADHLDIRQKRPLSRWL